MDVPVYIISRDRVTPMQDLIRWLRDAGISRITILDNKSTYEPLLEYYRHLEDGVTVQYMNDNLGPWVFWDRKMHEGTTSPYVVTDSDVVPADCCPKDLMDKLWGALQRHPTREKAGPGLRIDNLPDSFPGKQGHITAQEQYWKERLDGECFAAGIDTTFAMYKPKAGTSSEMHIGIRMDFPYVAEHRPWYMWPVPEEERYYREHADSGTWSSEAHYWNKFGWW